MINDTMKYIVIIIALMFFNGSVLAQDITGLVIGRWVGTYGNTEKDNPYYFSLEFLPEGKLNVINQNDKILATGNFSIQEENILITYRYTNDIIQYSCNGTLNKSLNQLYGTWQRVEDAGSISKFTQHGRWTMSKKSDSILIVRKKDTSLLNFTDRKNLIAANKKNFISTNIQYCADLAPANSRPLPARVPINYLTEYKILPDGTISPVAKIRQSLATYTEKMWEPGETITVSFDIIGGSINLIELIKIHAKEWELYANIKLEYVQNFADGKIRVGFNEKGSYSLVGRDALLAPATKTTMNFGWLSTLPPGSPYLRQVILHEFGHALGFVHEHQTFGTAIPWDKEKVYALYAEPPNQWTREEVDLNIFSKYAYTSTNYSSFDRQSIMLYPIPKELTTDGSSVSWNMELSATDKQYAALLYPFPTPPPTAKGILRTGDDCDEIEFTVEYDVVTRDQVEFNFQLGELNGKKVSWWKEITIPLTSQQVFPMWIQNHSLISSENRTSSIALIPLDYLNREAGISFAKAKVLGTHTPLSYKWNIMQALRGGCRITLVWRKDSCL